MTSPRHWPTSRERLIAAYAVNCHADANSAPSPGFDGARTRQPDWYFDFDSGKRLLCEQFEVASLAGFGAEGLKPAVGAAGALLQYAQALGLNIVIGFAGLLDLGYIAFYAVGAYTWALLASPHFGLLAIRAVTPDMADAILDVPMQHLRIGHDAAK